MTKLLFLYFFLLSTSCLLKPEKEVHYIPQGYTGKVCIVWEEPNGKPTEYYHDWRVYRIPACGVLKTKFAPPTVLRMNEERLLFLYMDAAGNVTDTLHLFPSIYNLDSVESEKFLTQNSNKVFIHQFGYLGFSYGDGKSYENAENYIVDTVKNRLKYKRFSFDKEEFYNCN